MRANASDKANKHPEIMKMAKECHIEARFLTLQQLADQHSFDLFSRNITKDDETLMEMLEKLGVVYMKGSHSKRH